MVGYLNTSTLPSSLSKFTILAVLTMVMMLTDDNAAWASQGQVETFRGVARDETGEVVYIENHRMVYQGQRHVGNQTRYLNSQGSEIAELNSSFDSHPYVPNYSFEDNRFGRKDGAVVEGDTVTVFGRKSASQPLQEKTVALTDRMITGQGLHFYIQDHLDELAAGAEKKVDFLFPLEAKTYSFRILRLDKPNTEPGVLWLRIESDNWFFRLFAPNLEVQYELASKKLLAYQGISNLLDANREMQNVQITYQYEVGK